MQQRFHHALQEFQTLLYTNILEPYKKDEKDEKDKSIIIPIISIHFITMSNDDKLNSLKQRANDLLEALKEYKKLTKAKAEKKELDLTEAQDIEYKDRLVKKIYKISNTIYKDIDKYLNSLWGGSVTAPLPGLKKSPCIRG